MSNRADLDVIIQYVYQVNSYRETLINKHSASDILKVAVLADIRSFNDTSRRFENDPQKLELQGVLIKIALDKGADVSSLLNDGGLSLKSMAAHEDLLLSHPTNPMAAIDFLRGVLRCGIGEYDWDTRRYKPNPDRIKLQHKLINSALDRGADINSIVRFRNGLFVPLNALSVHKDMLLNHPTNPLTADSYLALALQVSTVSYSSSLGQWNEDTELSKLQGELIKEALDKGADPNAILDATRTRQFVYLDVLYTHRDILLNHPTRSMTAINFLKAASQHNIIGYNATTEQNELNPHVVKVQREIINASLKKGADLNRMHRGFLPLEVLAEHKDALLNNPIHPLTADSFLWLAMRASAIYVSDSYVRAHKESIRYKLVEEAIALGANVNIEVETVRGPLAPLDMLQDDEKTIATLLKSYGAKCGSTSSLANEFILQEGLQEYSSSLYKYGERILENLSAPKAEVNKIPYIIHHVWLTNIKTPKELDPRDIRNVIQTKQTLKQSTKEWVHIVWTNAKALIPQSASILEKHGIEVRSIQDIKDDLRLYDRIDELIEHKLWGLASDALRYSVVELHGGVYADLDFEFVRNIEGELYKFDYFSQDFVNYFFAAKPEHPIVTTLLDTVERNLGTPPSYVASTNASHIFMKTLYTSLLPFSLAYLKSSNLDSNVDIVYPDLTTRDGQWLEEGKCQPWIDIFKFTEHLGVCGIQGLLIGYDGSNGRHATWMDEL
jgi:hypothetical protein